MKLDFTKPYGTIYGHDEARYEQDGHLFRANGAPVTPPPPAPAGDMVIETDAPFLAPVPHRGKPNEPAHVAVVGTYIADLRGMDVVDFARVTTHNANLAFPRIAL